MKLQLVRSCFLLLLIFSPSFAFADILISLSGTVDRVGNPLDTWPIYPPGRLDDTFTAVIPIDNTTDEQVYGYIQTGPFHVTFPGRTVSSWDFLSLPGTPHFRILTGLSQITFISQSSSLIDAGPFTLTLVYGADAGAAFPDILQFQPVSGRMRLWGGLIDEFIIGGTINANSVTVSYSLPEPSTFALLAIGCAVLWISGRRKDG